MISKLLTKVKNEKDSSIMKGGGLLAKNKQDAPGGLFKSFFTKLQEDISDSKNSGKKTGSRLASGKETSSGKLSKKDTVLGGKFSLKDSDSKSKTSSISNKKTVKKEQNLPDQIIQNDISESTKAESANKGDKSDISKKKEVLLKANNKKGGKKADSKKTAEQPVHITGKEISSTKVLNKEQTGNGKDKTVAVVDENSKKQQLSNGKKEDKASGKTTADQKGKSFGKVDTNAMGLDVKAGDLKGKNTSDKKVIVESPNSDSGKWSSVNEDQKTSKADEHTKNNHKIVKAVVDNKKGGIVKGISDQNPVDMKGRSIKKNKATEQLNVPEKSKEVPTSTKAEVKKNSDGQDVFKNQPDTSIHNQDANKETQKEPPIGHPKKSDEKITSTKLKSTSVDEKIAGDGAKKKNIPASSDKRFKILSKNRAVSPVVKERANTAGKVDRQVFTRQQKIVANNFSQIKNGKDAGLAGAMEKVAEQVTSQNGKGKKSERHRGKNRGRLSLSNRSSKSSLRTKMFAGFTGKDSGDYGNKEQQFKWKQQDFISPEGDDKEKLSKGMASSGFKLSQIPVTNAFLRQRIIPGLTKVIKNAAGSNKNGNNTGKWENHNFVLDDGKDIHLSLRENKGVLQVKMGSLNVELRKLLQQNMHQIKQHLKQEFGTHIDLQFSNSGEQQSSQSFKGSSQPGNTGNISNQFSDGNVVTQAEGRGGVNSVRNFGYNQMEWQA